MFADRSKHVARRAISGIVSTASNAYYGRWYYSNRWHPHHAMLQRALDETADYIGEHMTSAMIKRGDIAVLDGALNKRPSMASTSSSVYAAVGRSITSHVDAPR